MKFKDPMCKSQLSFHFVLLALLLTATQSGFAQTPPLNFSNNFFVTGDYVVAGAYNMTKSFTTINGISYAVGTINVPDTNPGIQGATSIPPGAQVIAALLYWQTVEKTSAIGSGANGYFRPLLYAGKGGPAVPGYLIQGTPLNNETVNPVPTGCSGTLNGKVIQTYRSDVAGGLPVDANGNSSANGSFEVRLPSTNNGQPFALGATLVIIYRIPAGAGGPNIPLNSILIFDGAYPQNNLQPTMTQPMPGTYGPIDTDANTITRLTHIVGSGASNKSEIVSLGPDANHLTKLSSPYGNSLPAFPGWYGNWDNTTWTFRSNSPLANDTTGAATQVAPAPMNQACVSWGAVIMSTTVKNSDNDGILDSWKSNGGYCDYLSSPSCGGSGTPGWIALDSPTIGKKDIYLHYDYLCSQVTGQNSCAASSFPAPLSAVGAASGATATYSGTFSPAFSQNITTGAPPNIPAGTLVTISGFATPANNGQFVVAGCCKSGLVVYNQNAVVESVATDKANGKNVSPTATYGDYSFDPTQAKDPQGNTVDAVQKVVDTFNNHTGSAGSEPFVLHVERGNAIQEAATSCADTDTDQNGNLNCVFPNEPGTIGFREGLAWIKNSTINTGTGSLGLCTPSLTCVGFQHGKKDSYHYALFSHGVGLASWSLSDTSLQSVKQTGSTVTFTTKSSHGLTPIAGDSVCSAAKGYVGRVTVLYAITNPNLNGTFCATKISGTQFSVTLPNKPVLPGTVLSSYSVLTDPNLSVADGNVTTMSGYSDLGGQNSVISLGEGGWGPVQNLNPPSEGNKWNVKAGTFMHELGHTLGLTHGGTFLNNLPKNPNDFTPTYEVNCKPNVQTVMSYVFQFDLLKTNQTVNNVPVKVLDFSQDPNFDIIPTLTEANGDAGLGTLTYPFTSWFVPSKGSVPSNHCDGSPTGKGESAYVYTSQPISDFTFSAGQDVNFNGSTTDVMHPHNEWEGTPAAADGSEGPSPGADLQQVSAAGTVSAIGPGGEVNSGGGYKPAGTGGGFKPAGTGGGLKPAGTGGAGFTPAGGGGGYKPAGTGGAPIDITHNQASSYPRPPDNLFIQQEEASPRTIDLGWIPASFGTAVQYNIYQSSDGGQTFANVRSVSGSTTSAQITVNCSLTSNPPNPAGYFFQVKAVTISDSGAQSESSPSNTVPAPGEPALTGCYLIDPANGLSNFTVPASGIQGSDVSFSFTLVDDFIIVNQGDIWKNAKQNGLSTLSSGKLFVNGPGRSATCTTTPANAQTPVGMITNGVAAPLEANDSFSGSGNSYSFTWSNINTDNRCSGTYTFELDLDGGQKITSSPLSLGIDINDQDTPRITTFSVPPAIADVAYNYPLTEHGGVGSLTWTVTSGSLPPGTMTLDPNSGTISGYAIAAGTYPFTVTVKDSAGNTGTQAFQLVVKIFVSATQPGAGPPFTPNPTLPDATVGVAYNHAVTGLGGTGALTWAITGTPPSGISPQAVNSPTLSGTTCAVGASSYNLSASVLDSATPQNSGMQALTLQVDKGSTTTSITSNVPTSVFQQPVTFTVTVASSPASSCIPSGGTVTLYDGQMSIRSKLLPNGTGTVTFTTPDDFNLLVGIHSITASYSGDTNFKASTLSPAIAQTVKPAQTEITNVSVSSSTSPAFVGQPINVSYSLGVSTPGAGTPITPTGSILIKSNDGSACTPLALGLGCTLTPAPTAAGTYTLTLTYSSGDGNFSGTAANGIPYTVDQLVFTTQPSSAGVGLTITPAVQVTAEDSTGNTLGTFGGNITLAIGPGPNQATVSGNTRPAISGVATFNNLSINKIGTGYTLTASPDGVNVSQTSTAFDIDTFYVDSQGNFGTLDLLTGAVTQIGAPAVQGANGIDLTLPPSLGVYAYTASNQLFQITPSTGVANQVGTGTTGSIPDQATTGALTNGSYFGIDAVTGNLYSIDLTSGQTTPIGGSNSDGVVLPAGCTLETSLTGSASVLYYTIGYSGASCTNPMSDSLYQIDPTSGAITGGPFTITVNGSGVNEFVGSAFVGGTLYGFTSGGQEYTIDPATGVATSPVSTTPTTAIIGAGSQ
jgi:hypothetical protein